MNSNSYKQVKTAKEVAVGAITKPDKIKQPDIQKQLKDIKRDIDQRERNLRLENANNFR